MRIGGVQIAGMWRVAITRFSERQHWQGRSRCRANGPDQEDSKGRIGGATFLERWWGWSVLGQTTGALVGARPGR